MENAILENCADSSSVKRSILDSIWNIWHKNCSWNNLTFRRRVMICNHKWCVPMYNCLFSPSYSGHWNPRFTNWNGGFVIYKNKSSIVLESYAKLFQVSEYSCCIMCILVISVELNFRLNLPVKWIADFR